MRAYCAGNSCLLRVEMGLMRAKQREQEGSKTLKLQAVQTIMNLDSNSSYRTKGNGKIS